VKEWKEKEKEKEKKSKEVQLKPASHPAATPNPATTAAATTRFFYHCLQAAHGAADDSMSSCLWINEAEYSSQGF